MYNREGDGKIGRRINRLIGGRIGRIIGGRISWRIDRMIGEDRWEEVGE